LENRDNIYLAQVNNEYGPGAGGKPQAFLPYSVGLLQSYAQTIPTIRENYNFSGFVYLREPIGQVLNRLDNPTLFAVSCYIWNWSYSSALAKAVKERFPNCLVVMGGPHVPVKSDNFFRENSYADILIHYEGEGAFADILLERLKEEQDYTSIPGLSVKGENCSSIKTLFRPRFSDLDVIPSPYLTGVFDELMKHPFSFHSTIETNRGCGYSCTFCDWGSNILAKLKAFSTERLIEEFYWFGEHKIDLLYGADANYGIMKRDIELTEKMAEVKRKYGFPNKFRVAYAKNSNDIVYQIARILNSANMNKGVTLSFQSMNDHTLTLIKRKNIKIQDFQQLIKKYNQEGIATYSEIIIGLPGETYDTFADGLDLLVSKGQHRSLSIYLCEILPNSEMNQESYKAEHGIITQKTPVLFFHGTPSHDPYQEYYELVVGTKTLPQADWLKCNRISWAFQSFHCLPLTQFIAIFLNRERGISYRKFYEGLIAFADNNPESVIGQVASKTKKLFEGILEGKDWGIVDQQFGDIIWPPEEWTYLKGIVEKERFYEEIHEYLPDLPDDVIIYQKNIIRSPYEENNELELEYDLYSYFEFDTPLKKERVVYNFVKEKYADLETFARDVVWFGRKGGTFTKKVKS